MNTTVGMIVFCWIATFAGIILTTENPKDQNNTEDLLLQIIELSSDKYPRKVTDQITADSIEASGKTLIYRYTLHDVENWKKPEEVFTELIKPGLIDYTRKAPKIDAFRERGIEMRHIYEDPLSSYAVEIVITPDDY